MSSLYDTKLKKIGCVVILFVLTPLTIKGHETKESEPNSAQISSASADTFEQDGVRDSADQKSDELVDSADDSRTIDISSPHAESPEDDTEFEDNDDEYEDDEDAPANSGNPFEGKRISDIVISGNKMVPADAILDRIPYRVGETFDATKTRALINRLYFDLKRFRNISIYAKNTGADSIALHVVLQEKPVLQDVIIEGSKKVTEKEIREKISFDNIPAIDEQELKQHAQSINRLYKEKGYHNVRIDSSFVVNELDQATATFTITEHQRALVKRVEFKGNHTISSKKLRGIIFTRQDWILGFMDKSGTFQYERIDADKQVIEQFYHNNGYLNVKVVDAIVDFDERSSGVFVTYEIQEGDLYTIADVKVSGNDILKDDFLASMIPIKAGDVYSRESIVNAIKNLEYIWGDMGYVYAHVEPSIIPDEETRTVHVSFNTELGAPVYLNKLSIQGNKKTRDKIIRRKINLEEGMLITNRAMDSSKSRIEALGFFDQRDGVNWKMTRLDENSADLDLIVKEAKTGSAHVKLGFGGSAQSMSSPSTGVSLEANVADSNLFGSGVRFNLTGRLSGDEKTVAFNLTQPWLFDKPVYGSWDMYHRRLGYDEFTQTRPVNEKQTGGILTTGFTTGAWHRLFVDTFMRFSIGIDDIRYEGNDSEGKRCSVVPTATLRANTALEENQARAAYNEVLKKLFDPGAFVTASYQMGKDTKNHPINPTRGYAWLARSLLAIPSFSSNIGFYKMDFDVNWLTPLIGEYDLIFRLHMYFGFVTRINKKYIPYRELYHIGGPASVRGYLYGQIGPQFTTEFAGRTNSDSIGGKKAMFMNAELQFPITNDFTMKGVMFYDGGAGWDNPYADDIPKKYLRNNSFSYRHAIGVGIRLLQPMPIRVDWGFKLDPRKGESAHEVHFAMTYDW